MAPVAASTSLRMLLRLILLQFFGAGYDEVSVWQQSFTQNETPVNYSWDFGDGSVSGLKNLFLLGPIWKFQCESSVIDRGGGVSSSYLGHQCL